MSVPPPLPEYPDERPPGSSKSSGEFGTALRMPYVLVAGAIYGLLMRMAFGAPIFSGVGDRTAGGAMLSAFVVLVPLLIGALTVYFSGGRARGFAYSIIAPWLPVMVFVAGTAILLIEGSICIAMAMPIFLLMSSLGGISMWLVLRVFRPSPVVMHSLLALPLFAGLWEQHQPLPASVTVSEASIYIAAKPEVVWRLINNARAIRPVEMSEGLAYRIGVPYPQEAVTVLTAQGRVRKLRWDKGVRFDEPISDWRENRYIRWRYSFLPGSIPADALDEHVTIGGKYFDLVDTAYRLTPVADGTRLDIHVTYRISTNFNWYAGLWGRILVDDAANTILAFYKHRAEGDGPAAGID